MTHDESTIERFKRQVEEEWTDPKLALAYRKWDRDESEWGRAARDTVIQRTRLSAGMKVLDLGSGHGEPALEIAQKVGPAGRVTLTDLSAELLEIAAERARALGLGNVTTQVADARRPRPCPRRSVGVQSAGGRGSWTWPFRCSR